MKFKFLLFFFPLIGFSQEESPKVKTYTQFEIAFPFIGNENRYDPVSGTYDQPRIVIDGIGAKFGVGLHYNKWLGIAVHSGIDYKISAKLVAVPIYANLRIAPNFGNDSRLIVQAGYGFGTAIGRGNLSGEYAKCSLGFGDSDRQIYVEYAKYGFSLDSPSDIYSFSLGIALTIF